VETAQALQELPPPAFAGKHRSSSLSFPPARERSDATSEEGRKGRQKKAGNAGEMRTRLCAPVSSQPR